MKISFEDAIDIEEASCLVEMAECEAAFDVHLTDEQWREILIEDDEAAAVPQPRWVRVAFERWWDSE